MLYDIVMHNDPSKVLERRVNAILVVKLLAKVGLREFSKAYTILSARTHKRVRLDTVVKTVRRTSTGRRVDMHEE